MLALFWFNGNVITEVVAYWITMVALNLLPFFLLKFHKLLFKEPQHFPSKCSIGKESHNIFESGKHYSTFFWFSFNLPMLGAKLLSSKQASPFFLATLLWLYPNLLFLNDSSKMVHLCFSPENKIHRKFIQSATQWSTFYKQLFYLELWFYLFIPLLELLNSQ